MQPKRIEAAIIIQTNILKVSNEARIGIIGFITLAVVLFAFNYLNRRNVFSRNLIITARFDALNFIHENDAVFVKGRQVGKVVAIYIEDGSYKVDMDIDPYARIPKTATAEITELSVMGGQMVNIHHQGVCTNNCLVSGDEIEGTVSSLQERIAAQAKPILDKVGSFADSLMGPNGMDQTFANAYASLNSLKKNTQRLGGSIKGADIPGNARYYREFTDVLLNKKTNAPAELADTRALALQLDSLVGNLAGLTQKDIEGMVEIIYTARTAGEKVPDQIKGFEGTITTANNTLDTLQNSLQAYLPGSEGMIPTLLYDETFRDSTQWKIQDWSDLFKDIRLHPEKYLKF